ncbi:MAG: hypothetical protein HQL65_06025 [Magnetococcales bacterium]|nr:hypothetical protein [Magnetococcales bacterium]MBF0155027.1 hypothetical protein [Magnetococcales bacterium]
MGELVIRNMDDEMIKQLKDRAAAQCQSLEQSLREILIGALSAARKDLAPESAHLINAEREARMAFTSVDYLVSTADQIAAMGSKQIDVDVVAMIREDRERR